MPGASLFLGHALSRGKTPCGSANSPCVVLGEALPSPGGVMSPCPRAPCHTDIPACQLLAREQVELGGAVGTAGHQPGPKKEQAGLAEGACPRGISPPSYPTSLQAAELFCTDFALSAMEQLCVFWGIVQVLGKSPWGWLVPAGSCGHVVTPLGQALPSVSQAGSKWNVPD